MIYAGICVDDDPHILQMLSLQLDKLLDRKEIILEFFTEAADVPGCIKGFIERGIPVRFLISDYRMPGISGYELLCSVKENYPAISCLLLSGQADKFEVRELIDNTVISSYLSKPWTSQELQRALQKGAGITLAE